MAKKKVPTKEEKERLTLVLFSDKTQKRSGERMAELLDDCRRNNFWRLPTWKQ